MHVLEGKRRRLRSKESEAGSQIKDFSGDSGQAFRTKHCVKMRGVTTRTENRLGSYFEKHEGRVSVIYVSHKY